VVRQRAKRTRMSALRGQRLDAIGVGGEVNEPIGSQRKEWAGAEPRRRDERQPYRGQGVCLRRDSQSRLVELHALADSVIHHVRDIAAAFGEGQEIHPCHLLAEGADVEVIDRLPQPSAHARRSRFRLLSGLLHAVSNLN
jgi:hypothetical protein